MSCRNLRCGDCVKLSLCVVWPCYVVTHACDQRAQPNPNVHPMFSRKQIGVLVADLRIQSMSLACTTCLDGLEAAALHSGSAARYKCVMSFRQWLSGWHCNISSSNYCCYSFWRTYQFFYLSHFEGALATQVPGCMARTTKTIIGIWLRLTNTAR